MIDMQTIVERYTSNTNETSQTLALSLGLKPIDVAAILRLNGIKLRRGTANGSFSPETRSKSLKTRRDKALKRALNDLLESYGETEVAEVWTKVLAERNSEGS